MKRPAAASMRRPAAAKPKAKIGPKIAPKAKQVRCPPAGAALLAGEGSESARKYKQDKEWFPIQKLNKLTISQLLFNQQIKYQGQHLDFAGAKR